MGKHIYLYQIVLATAIYFDNILNIESNLYLSQTYANLSCNNKITEKTFALTYFNLIMIQCLSIKV